jgi:hypothetical protein
MEQSGPVSKNAEALSITPEQFEQIVVRAVRATAEVRGSSPAEEPKWTVSNILFIIFTLLIGALIGYFVDYFKSRQQEKTYSLQIASPVGNNLIAWDKYAQDKVVIAYKSEAGKELPVRSYYSIQGKILNAGNQKFQNLTFRFASDKELHLIKNPQFTILPKQERPYLEVKQIPQTAINEDEWTFSELAPGEYIEFQYLALSEQFFAATPRLTIVPKEPKDQKYNVSYKQDIETKKAKEKSFFTKSVTELTGYDVFMLSFLAIGAPSFYVMMALIFISRRRVSRASY